MNVLSLFDGMSCGQIALDKLGIKVDNYFASEIDHNAIKVTKSNYPNTIHLGSVVDVKGADLPKIDLLIGGSPCQGFSFAGQQLNFEDPRSKLFFEYVRLLKECNPKYFLLENVKMKKDHQDVISKYLGVEPIEIDSKVITSGRRRRLYWTNIGTNTVNLFGIDQLGIDQPKDKDLTLQSILNDGITDKNKAYCLTLHRGNLRDYFKKKQTNIVYLPSKDGRYVKYDSQRKSNVTFGKK